MLRHALFGGWLGLSVVACGQGGSALSPSAAGSGGTALAGSSGATASGGASAAAGFGTSGSATNGSGGNASGGVPSGAGAMAMTAGASAFAGASSGGSSAGRAAGGGMAGTSGESGGRGGAGGVAGVEGGMGGTCPVGGGASEPSPRVAVKDLPVIDAMPDPLTMNDGTKVTTPEQWKARRQEMIKLLEDYEYGHMPPPPCNVKATTVTATKRLSVNTELEADYRMLHLSFGADDELGFDLGLFMPTDAAPAGGFPILIVLASSTNEKSIGSAVAAFSRGYAVATVPYQQLGADASNWASTGFFPAYPDSDWRDFSAWAWGLSRSVDYLVTDPQVDAGKIMITGVSRLAQAVLLAGAFDERIALSAPVAGGAALRFSGKEMGMGLGQGVNEVVDQNTYWFGPRLPDFKNQTPRLPSDQHWLPALTAPRLFIMCNSLADQYGRAYAAVQTYLAAKPAYDFLGAEAGIGVSFREGSHGMTAEDWSALLDFSDQYLRKLGGTKRFDVLPPPEDTP